MIDFGASSTEILLNPRLPAAESERLRRIVDLLPPLTRHVWLTTSGSGGNIKLVALSKQAILESADGVNRHLEATAADVWCCPLPLFHVGGLGIVARALRSGGRALVLDRWTPGAFVDLVRNERITLASLVPAQVRDLIEAGTRAPATLRAVIVGGGSLSSVAYEQARSLDWPLLPSYGMTETSSQVATAPLESLERDELPGLRLLDHLEAREAGGRLAFRGRSLFTAYGSDGDEGPVMTDPKLDGWFVSEDTGEVKAAADGVRIVPTGRSADFLKIGGESVSLGRLDEILASVLRSHPGVDAAVVAVPDARLGSVIHLAVDQAEAADAIRASFSDRVLPFERPRAVHVMPVPRSPLGKLRRDALLAAVRGSTRLT
ncbi:MAG TPA: AMP-binding protein [Thermoanaerobaculia bacterium]|nr:AMP-binding protein [Thermoanaerobaculia bacterium]